MKRTQRQTEASRNNGALSRGPVTPEGKARVAQNGATHGIYSKVVVLNNENHAAYADMRDAHIVEWAPATETEYNLVIDIVDARWRLRRFSVLETAALDFEVDRMRPEIADTFEQIDEGTRTSFAFNALISNNRTFEVLQTAIRHQYRIIDRATRQLITLGKLRRNGDNDGSDGGGGGSNAAAGHHPGTSPDTQADALDARPASDTQQQFRPAAADYPPAAKHENRRTKPEIALTRSSAARNPFAEVASSTPTSTTRTVEIRQIRPADSQTHQREYHPAAAA